MYSIIHCSLWDRYPSLGTIITSDKHDALAVKKSTPAHALKIKIAHPSSKNWLSIHNTKGGAIWFRVIQPTIQSFMNTYEHNAQYNRAQGQGPTEGQPMHSKWKLVTQVQKLITYSKTKGMQSGLGNPTHNPFIHEHTGTQCTYKHNKRPAHALKNEKWTPKFQKPYIVKKNTSLLRQQGKTFTFTSCGTP